MLKSHVIEVNGTFLGAAVRMAHGYRFVAVSAPVKPLDGSTWPTLDEARHAAARAFLTATRTTVVPLAIPAGRP